MFTEAERVKIRRYLGYSRMYLSADPRLESAILTVQSVADGGSAPDSSTEADIRANLTSLATLETQLESLWTQAQALQAGTIKIYIPIAQAALRADGRRLVGYIADALEIHPRRDVFTGKPSDDHDRSGYGE